MYRYIISCIYQTMSPTHVRVLIFMTNVVLVCRVVPMSCTLFVILREKLNSMHRNFYPIDEDDKIKITYCWVVDSFITKQDSRYFRGRKKLRLLPVLFFMQSRIPITNLKVLCFWFGSSLTCWRNTNLSYAGLE